MLTRLARRSSSARHALIEDIKEDRRGWLQNGVAALAVSALGIGVSVAVMITGTSHQNSIATTEPQGVAASAPAPAPSAIETTPSTRPAAPPTTAKSGDQAAKLKALADQRAEDLDKTEVQVEEVSQVKAAKVRAAALTDQTRAARERATSLAQSQTAAGATGTQNADPPPVPTTPTTETVPTDPDAKNCLPVTGGYSIAARFGDVGAWARYHTGFDFSAPVGTPLHAPSAGVVTNAGSGPASGWAGNYVAIQYPDGTQSLMAHMSTVSVHVGEAVTPCQLVGAIGMTGRTFGPHVHFEIYPAGIAPGDVYSAVNPVPWLTAHSLTP